jgi:hypothetical protein
MFTDHMPHTYEKVLKRLADPSLEIAKRYHKRLLRLCGAKWVTNNSELTVYLNPMNGRSKAMKCISRRMEEETGKEELSKFLQSIRHRSPSHLENPNVRVYQTDNLSVTFVPQLSLPTGPAPSPDQTALARSIPVLPGPTGVAHTTEEDSDVCSDDFFSCEEPTEDVFKELSIPVALSPSPYSRQNAEEPLSRAVWPSDDLAGLQSALKKFEQELNEREKQLDIREDGLMERERALAEAEARKKKKKRSLF